MKQQFKLHDRITARLDGKKPQQGRIEGLRFGGGTAMVLLDNGTRALVRAEQLTPAPATAPTRRPNVWHRILRLVRPPTPIRAETAMYCPHCRTIAQSTLTQCRQCHTGVLRVEVMFQTAQRTIDTQKKYIAALANENSQLIAQSQAARARKPKTVHAVITQEGK